MEDRMGEFHGSNDGDVQGDPDSPLKNEDAEND